MKTFHTIVQQAVHLFTSKDDRSDYVEQSIYAHEAYQAYMSYMEHAADEDPEIYLPEERY